jgi:hypothetical protein
LPISAADALQVANQGLQKIDDAAMAARYVHGHAGVPLFVTRLDKHDRNYYLVPWEDSRGVLIVVQVDASTGQMLSAAALPTPLSRLVMTPDEARRIVEARLEERPLADPRLVWQPSRESASPLQPLYHFPVEDGDAFVGIDGSLYRKLTPFGKGG